MHVKRVITQRETKRRQRYQDPTIDGWANGHILSILSNRAIHRDNRKPWSPTRATKRGGRTGNLLMVRECLRIADNPAKTPEARAEGIRLAGYFQNQSKRARAYILRSGANWYCNDCGKRFPCTKCVIQNRPPANTPPETYCQSCADARGLSYSTPGSYMPGDWYRFEYSL